MAVGDKLDGARVGVQVARGDVGIIDGVNDKTGAFGAAVGNEVAVPVGMLVLVAGGVW